MLNITINLLYYIPIFGILLLLILPTKYTKLIALNTTIISLIYTLIITQYYNPILGIQFVESFNIMGKFFVVGLDGISINFILLTAFIFPICVLTSYTITTFVKEYFICLLTIQVFLFGVFSVMDLLGFYILYEGVLIPMFLIIGV